MNIYTFILQNMNIYVIVFKNKSQAVIAVSIIYSTVSNEKFKVSCMGKMVYVYEKNGREAARFSLDGAEYAVISSDGDTFAVKTKDGSAALYSFKELKQTAFMKCDDDFDNSESGMTFSADGKKLYNIENGAVCVYGAGAAEECLKFENIAITHIECVKEIFVLGKEKEKFFVAKLDGEKLIDVKYISGEEFEFYNKYKCAENKGFSSAAMEHYFNESTSAESIKTSLSELWNKNEA